MEFNNPRYNLFLRNWKRGAAQEEHLTKAVDMGYLTPAEKEKIMTFPQDETV